MTWGLETGGRLLGGLVGGLGGAGQQGVEYGARGAVAGAAGGALVGGVGIVTGPGELVIEPAAIGTGAVVGGGLGAIYGAGKGFIQGVPAGADKGAEYGRRLSDWISQMVGADEKADKHPDQPTDGCAGQCGDATPSQQSKPTTPAPVAADPPTDVYIDPNKYPEAAKHVENAQDAGHPAEGTIDRAGAAARRRAATSGTPTQTGNDRDEYPPAIVREGGGGSSVRSIPKGDNRGAGGSMGGQIRDLPDGSRIRIIPGPKP